MAVAVAEQVSAVGDAAAGSRLSENLTRGAAQGRIGCTELANFRIPRIR
jgi:hypothetical protein